MNLKESNLVIAKDLMLEENLTLCLYNGKESVKSSLKGIKPLLDLIESNKDYSSFSCSDKVIGKAAAFLYILLNIKEIYCRVISQSALLILTKYNINISYDIVVPFIRNRKNDGYCPMETRVIDIDNPYEAYNILKK